MKKLAIITSHPIQYNAPLFRLLTERKKIEVKVFYSWGQTKEGLVYDPDFRKEFQWDIPLLDGYEAEFIENTSAKPGAGSFYGISNKNLIERINTFNPDSILVYGWSFKSHLQVLRYFKNKKTILFRGDSTLLDEPSGVSLKKMARRIFLKWVYSHIDVALFTGEANRQYFLKHGLVKSQLQYAPHAVENERFFDADGSKERKANEWRKELNISNSSFVFLYAGKLEPKKNISLLIEAFKVIPDPDIRLLLIGNGVLEQELKQMAANDKRIHFLDFQNQKNMPFVYRLGNVFVLPSKGPGETWGLSVNEAMASSKPIIVSNKCGCATDLVTNNGFIFKSESKEELTNAMRSFFNNEELVNEMSKASKNNITEFTFQKIAEGIEAVV